LNKVRHLGIHRTSLGSLSEAQQVFDAALLEKVIAELARRLPTPALPAWATEEELISYLARSEQKEALRKK
ncbi:MAG: hypothetical protein Q7U57_19580, partial [Methylovulum sp.]|nr:hypothetical protein [Methylovulum sp.]